MPADGRRIEKDLSSLHGGEPGGFRIPLVPADERSYFSVASLKCFEAEIARRKIKLFVVKRVVRDMHFAVLACDSSVGIDDYRGIVINPSGSLFKKRRDNDDFVVFGELSQSFCTRAGNGFGKFKVLMIFALAKVPRTEQFLEADDLCTLLGGSADS